MKCIWYAAECHRFFIMMIIIAIIFLTCVFRYLVICVSYQWCVWNVFGICSTRCFHTFGGPVPAQGQNHGEGPACLGPMPRRHFGSQAWAPGWKAWSKNEQLMQIMRRREHIWKYMKQVWNKYEIFDELQVHTMYIAYIWKFPSIFLYICSILLEIVGWSRLCRCVCIATLRFHS